MTQGVVSSSSVHSSVWFMILCSLVEATKLASSSSWIVSEATEPSDIVEFEFEGEPIETVLL